jgi:ribonuclease P/MRP protein subunit RPP40
MDKSVPHESKTKSDTFEWVDVTRGVPQGSVLGSLLFLLYINDMPDDIKNICKMYADDTKLISHGEKTSKLQNDLDKIMDWTQRWLMKLNICKCNYWKD